MKPFTKLILVSGITLLLGFFVGRFFQHQQTGYRFELIEETSHDFPLGELSSQHGFESIGLELINTNTTLIRFENRLLYKAKRGFQDGAPVVRNLQVRDQEVSWEDGDFRYELMISAMLTSNKGEPAD